MLQSAIVLLNLVPIAAVMLPAFSKQVAPKIPAGLSDHYYAVAFTHTILGRAAELLGLYVILSAGTRVLPKSFRIRKYKPWMRTALVPWWSTVLLGFATY